MRLILTLFFLSVFYLSQAQVKAVIKFNQLEKLMAPETDSLVVINFWATWCAPCVKELPLLEKFQLENPAIKVTLINLDFADKIDKVKTFVTRKKMQSEVYLLDEIDYNSWIDKVDKGWGGAIPATLIINPKTGRRKFVEKELQAGELEGLISEISK